MRVHPSVANLETTWASRHSRRLINKSLGLTVRSHRRPPFVLPQRVGSKYGTSRKGETPIVPPPRMPHGTWRVRLRPHSVCPPPRPNPLRAHRGEPMEAVLAAEPIELKYLIGIAGFVAWVYVHTFRNFTQKQGG